jgi:catechol 2,3-dioxygenase-like lactoylglutathione lyase family enzyme
MKLEKIMIFVSDLAEAKSFYCDVLGLPFESENENHLKFAHEGCEFIAFKLTKPCMICAAKA